MFWTQQQQRVAAIERIKWLHWYMFYRSLSLYLSLSHSPYTADKLSSIYMVFIVAVVASCQATDKSLLFIYIVVCDINYLQQLFLMQRFGLYVACCSC